MKYEINKDPVVFLNFVHVENLNQTSNYFSIDL